jgi:hypothetical protein
MYANQIVAGQAEIDYDASSSFFDSKLPHQEEFYFTGEEIADLIWNAVNATADAMEAGVGGIEVRLRAAAFVMRQYAIGVPTCIGSDRAWDDLLTAQRAGA